MATQSKKGKLQPPELGKQSSERLKGFTNRIFMRRRGKPEDIFFLSIFSLKMSCNVSDSKMPGMGGAIGVGIALGRTKNMVT